MEKTNFNCETTERTVSVFRVCPKSRKELVWKQMQEMRDSFHCDK